MNPARSVTDWIVELGVGDEEAAARIWERFFIRVRGLAHAKLGGVDRRRYDEEDLATSALNALCVGARESRFRQLESREDLWQILVMLTARKASNRRRAEARELIGGESALGDIRGAMNLIEGEPDEAFVDTLGFTCRERLDTLEPRLREVALFRLEGYSNEEIAERLGRSLATVERYLRMIRQAWARD